MPTLLLQESVIAYNLLSRLYLLLTGHHVLQLWNRFSSKPIAVLKSFQLKNISVPGIILSCYILCIFSEIVEKLVCKTVMQQHFGHVCSIPEPFGWGFERCSLCWSVAVPLPWKRTKLSRRKIFILRVDSSYIKQNRSHLEMGLEGSQKDTVKFFNSLSLSLSSSDQQRM